MMPLARNEDCLSQADSVEFSQYLPRHCDEQIAQRQYMMVPLIGRPMPPRSPVPTVWLVHLSHIKTDKMGRPGRKWLDRITRVRLLAAVQNRGRAAANVALHALRHDYPETADNDVRVVPVTLSLGDQSLTEREVLNDNLLASLVPCGLVVAASESVVDRQGDVHQNLIVVDEDAGVKMAPPFSEIPWDARGFDGVIKAARATLRLLSRNPAGPVSEAAAPAAASAEAALPVGQAAASTRDAEPPASPPSSTHVPTSPAGDVAAVDSEEPPVATEEGDVVDYGVDDTEPTSRGPAAVPNIATAADVVQALDDDARAEADMEHDEAVASAVARGNFKVLEEVLKEVQEHYGLQDAKVLVQEASEDSKKRNIGMGLDPFGRTRKRRKKPKQEPEAAPAEPAAAAASTRGPPRRQTMKSRVVVEQYDSEGTEKYSQVLAPTAMAQVIHKVIKARDRAVWDEANELRIIYAPPFPDYEAAIRLLIALGRAVLVRGAADGLQYLCVDAALQKRAKYEAFQEWASTQEGAHYYSDAGRFVIPRRARNALKTHYDNTFGGQIWFDVLVQLGGCPAEFVDAFNTVINGRREVAY